MSRFLTPFIAPPLALAGLSACIATSGVGPDYVSPTPDLPKVFSSPTTGVEPLRADGWATFGDPEVEALVRSVRESNRQLRAGLARLRQARALIGTARANGLPQIALEPSFQRAQTSDRLEVLPGVTAGRTVNTATLPFTLGWEIDLFGRIQRATEAASAEFEVAQADYDALLLLLEAEAVSTFLTIRALDLEQAVVEESVATQRSSAALVRRRFELGAVSDLDVARADSLLASSESDLIALQRARVSAQNALAVLVGRPASTFRIARAPLTGNAPLVPAGIPSELLLARPDLRRSERVLAAENARVGVATAAFYPSISLTGNLGQSATYSADLFDSEARFWAIRPEVYLPVFQGGRNRANLERAKARYEEALETYQDTVLVALSEVESALAAQRFFVEEVAAQQRAVEASLRARNVSLAQYEAGTIDYLDVLDAERTLLSARRTEARLRGTTFQNTVQLLRALGGPW